MSNEFTVFIEVLENSIKKNGKDKPITLGHLLNIAKLANKVYLAREAHDFKTLNSYEDSLWEHE